VRLFAGSAESIYTDEFINKLLLIYRFQNTFPLQYIYARSYSLCTYFARCPMWYIPKYNNIKYLCVELIANGTNKYIHIYIYTTKYVD
jgi:hypothetical protein